MIRLITGYAGTGHVTSADAGRFNAGVCGKNAYIMQTGEQLACIARSNNEIIIGSGDLVDQGRHFSIPQNSSETLTLENGSQGKSRYDAVVVRYSKDAGTGVESASMYVARGTETVKTVIPSKPEVTHGNIFNGEIIDDVVLYYIKITDLSIEKIERAIPIIPSLSTIADVIYPVGSIYMSMNATNPAKLFGGTWEQITDYFLRPFSKSGQTGGSDHFQLSVDNLPQHSHSIPAHSHSIPDHTHTATAASAGDHVHTFSKIKDVAAGTAKYTADSYGALGASKGETSKAGGHTHKITINRKEGLVTNDGGKGNTGNTGIAQPVYTLPPYLTVYAWKRTA